MENKFVSRKKSKNHTRELNFIFEGIMDFEEL